MTYYYRYSYCTGSNGRLASSMKSDIYSGKKCEKPSESFKDADFDCDGVLDEFEIIRYDLKQNNLTLNSNNNLLQKNPNATEEEYAKAAYEILLQISKYDKSVGNLEGVLKKYKNTNEAVAEILSVREAKAAEERAKEQEILAKEQEELALRQEKREAKNQMYASTDGKLGHKIRNLGGTGIANFMNENWSGELFRSMGMNRVADWLQNKDKVSTDGKDDGNLSFKEGATSFVKGLIGGIPKAMINHPVTTVLTIGACIGLTVLTDGAALPVLTAIGLATGVGTAGIGTYKAVTAKTDGEAKQAFETTGTGVTTTVISMLCAGKALNKAEQAGVRSAHIAEDANIFQKTAQTFKAVPESLKMSKELTISHIKGTPVNLEFVDGSRQTRVKGKLVNETLADGTYKEYENGILSKETLPDGTIRKYTKEGSFDREIRPDGVKREMYSSGTIEESFTDGSVRFLEKDGCIKECFPDGSYRYRRPDGTVYRELVIQEDGNRFLYDNGKLVKEEFPNGGYKRYNAEGIFTEGKFIEGDKTSFFEGGRLTREQFPNGGYKIYDASGVFTEGKIIDGENVRIYKGGVLIEERFFDINHAPNNSALFKVEYYNSGALRKQIYADGSYIKYDESGAVIDIYTGDGILSEPVSASAGSRGSGSGSSSSYDYSIGADYYSKDYYYLKNYGVTYNQAVSGYIFPED